MMPRFGCCLARQKCYGNKANAKAKSSVSDMIELCEFYHQLNIILYIIWYFVYKECVNAPPDTDVATHTTNHHTATK